MSDLKAVALQRAIKTLDSCGAKYKIIAEDGTEYGSLRVEKEPARQLAFPVGSIRNYFLPIIKDMKPGEVVIVPVKEFGVERIQGGIGAATSKMWGVGSTITQRRADQGCVEVMRIY